MRFIFYGSDWLTFMCQRSPKLHNFAPNPSAPTFCHNNSLHLKFPMTSNILWQSFCLKHCIHFSSNPTRTPSPLLTHYLFCIQIFFCSTLERQTQWYLCIIICCWIHFMKGVSHSKAFLHSSMLNIMVIVCEYFHSFPYSFPAVQHELTFPCPFLSPVICWGKLTAHHVFWSLFGGEKKNKSQECWRFVPSHIWFPVGRSPTEFFLL